MQACPTNLVESETNRSVDVIIARKLNDKRYSECRDRVSDWILWADRDLYKTKH